MEAFRWFFHGNTAKKCPVTCLRFPAHLIRNDKQRSIIRSAVMIISVPGRSVARRPTFSHQSTARSFGRADTVQAAPCKLYSYPAVIFSAPEYSPFFPRNIVVPPDHPARDASASVIRKPGSPPSHEQSHLRHRSLPVYTHWDIDARSVQNRTAPEENVNPFFGIKHHTDPSLS